jgi:hypothetical protein
MNQISGFLGLAVQQTDGCADHSEQAQAADAK